MVIGRPTLEKLRYGGNVTSVELREFDSELPSILPASYVEHKGVVTSTPKYAEPYVMLWGHNSRAYTQLSTVPILTMFDSGSYRNAVDRRRGPLGQDQAKVFNNMSRHICHHR